MMCVNRLPKICRFVCMTVLVSIMLFSCSMNFNIFGEWDYKLPNGYQIIRSSGDIIVLHMDHMIQLEDDPNGMTGIMIPNHITSFCYNDRYIGIQWILPEKIETADDGEKIFNKTLIKYYLVDSETDVKYGPFDSDEEFVNCCYEHMAGNFCDWITTNSAPNGATY